MAFNDLDRVLYNGEIKLEYKDAQHRYFARPRLDMNLPAEDPRAWGKTLYPKGTTTLLGDTLEKKGLMTWPLSLALKELFGYYDFIGDDGTRKQGFQNGVGTMWKRTLNSLNLITGGQEQMLPIIDSANKAWTRKQKEGADIGTTVHNAIEHYISNKAFDIATEHMKAAGVTEANKDLMAEITKAQAAFQQFVIWWEKEQPIPVQLEQIIYSRAYNVSGTFDALLRMKDGKLVLADFKTTSAAKSRDAAAPEGVYYSNFIQLGIYAMTLEEMGEPLPEDLLIVSCRKDGGFSTIYASELGITVQQAIDWGKAVIYCYQMMDQTKKQLTAHAEGM